MGLRVFDSTERRAEQHEDLPTKEAIGVESFSALLATYRIEHEQVGPMFTFADGLTLYVKTTNTNTKTQLCIRSWVEGAKVIVFARLAPWPDKGDQWVKQYIEFRGYMSRNTITRRYHPVKYRNLAEAYKVTVDKLLPISDLIDWLGDKYGRKENTRSASGGAGAGNESNPSRADGQAEAKETEAQAIAECSG